MTFVNTPKLHAKHQQTPLDIYYSNLEEAFGNLPIPEDDYASIEKVLKDFYRRDFDAEEHIQQFANAIDTIAEHYSLLAKALDTDGDRL